MTNDKNHQIIQIPDKEKRQSWLLQIVTLPKYLGEAIFALIGNKKTPESSKFILGYMLIAAFALLILGIISPETLKAFLGYFFQ